mgnify:CR=1 FL=1
MNRSPHVLVIVGSTRQGRNADKVVRWLMSRLDTRPDATFRCSSWSYQPSAISHQPDPPQERSIRLCQRQRS